MRDDWLEQQSYASTSYPPHFYASAYENFGKGKGTPSRKPEGVASPPFTGGSFAGIAPSGRSIMVGGPLERAIPDTALARIPPSSLTERW